MIDMALAAARAAHPGSGDAGNPGSGDHPRAGAGAGQRARLPHHRERRRSVELASRPRLSAEGAGGSTPPAASCPGLGATPVLVPTTGLMRARRSTRRGLCRRRGAAAAVRAGLPHRGAGVPHRCRQAVADLASRAAPTGSALGYLLDPALVDGACRRCWPWSPTGRIWRARVRCCPGASAASACCARPVRGCAGRRCKLRHVGPRSVCADIALLDAAARRSPSCWNAGSSPCRPAHRRWATGPSGPPMSPAPASRAAPFPTCSAAPWRRRRGWRRCRRACC